MTEEEVTSYLQKPKEKVILSCTERIIQLEERIDRILDKSSTDNVRQNSVAGYSNAMKMIENKRKKITIMTTHSHLYPTDSHSQ